MTTFQSMSSDKMMTFFLSILLLFVLLPTSSEAQDVILSNTPDCVQPNDQFAIDFDIENDSSSRSWYWVGLYKDRDVNRLSRSLARLEGEPELWVWTCGTQDCDNNERRGRVVFGDGRPGDWEADWRTLDSDTTHRAVVVNQVEDEEEPDQYLAVAYSSQVRLRNVCEEEDDDNADDDGDEDEDDNTDDDDDQEAEEEDTDDNGPLPSTGMRDVVRRARRDIAALIDDTPILSALFLRMVFHDCVGGGCDGCINTNNPENAGLTFGMNVLRDVESRYRRDGLSRADLWVLAAYTGIDMTLPGGDINDPFIPFVHYGRENCGASSPQRGPDPELCHPNMGTNEILRFFEENFDFDAQETAVIMGAHTIGVLRRRVLGFDGENGWVPNNLRFDNEYYEELVGDSSSREGQLERAPGWRRARVRNDDLRGIPDRHQWEGFPRGRKVVMLNSDIAMVRQIDDSNRDPETGEVECKFIDRAPDGNEERCPASRSDLFDSMVRYAESNSRFLEDFRDAFIKMTETGYRVRESTCDEDGMCELERRR